MDIPERLQRFPLWRGKYPVFFTVSCHPDGSPDFKTLSRDRQLQCAAKNLCFLCGQRMTAPYWFIVHEQEVDSRRILDNGPMHEECARYACGTCPYLINARYHSKTFVDQEGNPAGRVRIALCSAGSYSCDSRWESGIPRQHPYFQAGEWLSIDWEAVPQPEEISGKIPGNA